MTDGTATVAREKKTWFFSFARKVVTVLFHTVYPLKVHGREKLDRATSYVLICNHQGLLDPVGVAYACRRYEIRFMAKKELWNNKAMAWLVKALHAIPVDRHNSDMMAMRTCLKAVKEGHVLGIFPEGTRHKEGVMKEMEGGVGFLTLRSGVPLIPVMIMPAFKAFRRTNLYVGDPIDYEDLKAEGITKGSCDVLLERITARYESWQQEIAVSDK